MPPKAGAGKSAKVSGKSAKGSGKSAKGSGKSAGTAAKSTGSASKGSGKSTGSASKGSASKGSGAAAVYAKTARKDKDGRVVYRRAGSSADYVRRKDATGAIVYRKCASTRGGAPDEMIGGNRFTDALRGAVRKSFSRAGLCRHGDDVDGTCFVSDNGMLQLKNDLESWGGRLESNFKLRQNYNEIMDKYQELLELIDEEIVKDQERPKEIDQEEQDRLLSDIENLPALGAKANAFIKVRYGLLNLKGIADENQRVPEKIVKIPNIKEEILKVIQDLNSLRLILPAANNPLDTKKAVLGVRGGGSVNPYVIGQKYIVDIVTMYKYFEYDTNIEKITPDIIDGYIEELHWIINSIYSIEKN
jgi:hypothetical protein